MLAPEDRELLRFEQRGGMLRNILSPRVPALAAKHASAVLEEVLAEAKLPREKITGWVLHAGGREVLDALRDKMRLTPADVRVSAEVLREYGNLSSPFVLFVLQAALAEEKPGGFWWMSSFGAGFSCHGALLEVE